MHVNIYMKMFSLLCPGQVKAKPVVRTAKISSYITQ